MKNPEFARQVFGVITDGLMSNPKLPLVVGTEKSFEQWLNMETFLACKQAGLTCDQEWRYKTYNRADLCVTSEDAIVIVETKLVSDYTQDKYLSPIEADYFKLAELADPPGGSTAGLQIIVMCSMHGQITNRDSWTPWIGPNSQYIPWCDSPDLKRELHFSENGYVHIWGWLIDKSHSDKLRNFDPVTQKRRARTGALS
jgi:hypothetical protein